MSVSLITPMSSNFCIWYIHLHTHSEEDSYPSYFGRALGSCHTKAYTHKRRRHAHTHGHRKRLRFITSLHIWPVAAWNLTGCSSFISGNERGTALQTQKAASFNEAMMQQVGVFEWQGHRLLHANAVMLTEILPKYILNKFT